MKASKANKIAKKSIEKTKGLRTNIKKKIRLESAKGLFVTTYDIYGNQVSSLEEIIKWLEGLGYIVETKGVNVHIISGASIATLLIKWEEVE